MLNTDHILCKSFAMKYNLKCAACHLRISSQVSGNSDIIALNEPSVSNVLMWSVPQ